MIAKTSAFKLLALVVVVATPSTRNLTIAVLESREYRFTMMMIRSTASS